MSLQLTLVLAGPPKGKARHRTRVQKTKTGKVFAQEYPDPEGVKYESQLRYVAAQQMGDRPPTILPVRLHVEAQLQIAAGKTDYEKENMLIGAVAPLNKGSGDCDNFLKIVGDALNGIVWIDDCQILEASVVKRWALAPRLIVAIETIELPPVVERPSRSRKRRAETSPDLFAADG
jgi:Holliday junction resolvase RusA-like endonuclease